MAPSAFLFALPVLTSTLPASVQVVDTVASLKQLLATHPAAASPSARHRAAGGSVNGDRASAAGSSRSANGSSSSAARAAARAAVAKVGSPFTSTPKLVPVHDWELPHVLRHQVSSRVWLISLRLSACSSADSLRAYKLVSNLLLIPVPACRFAVRL